METEKTVSPLEAVLSVIVSYAFLLFVEVVILGALGSGVTGYAFAVVFSELAIAAVPLAYLLSKHIRIRNYIGSKINPRIILIGIASGGFLLLVDIIASAVLTAIFGVSQAVEEQNNLFISLSASPLGFVSVVIAMSLAGVCEEFTFRAFLQNAVTRRYSFAPALIISSVAFGLVHFDLQLVHIISALIVGLFLGYIYHRWNSYAVSAIAHSTVNLIVLAVLLLP